MARDERRGGGRIDPRTAGDRIRGAAGRIRTQHEDFWRKLNDRLDRLRQEVAVSMAEIVEDGGPTGARVRFDDEDDAREVPLRHRQGQRYRKGDRVGVLRTATGEEFVLGSIGAGDRQSVGDEDIVDLSGSKIKPGTIDGQQIKPNAIRNSELAGDAVDTGNIKNNAVTGAKLADSYAKSDHSHNWSEIKNTPNIPNEYKDADAREAVAGMNVTCNTTRIKVGDKEVTVVTGGCKVAAGRD